MLENNVYNNYVIIKDRYKAVEEAINKLGSNDILLLLGKGHEEYIIVGNDKIPYNDRKAVNSIIKSKESVTI